MRRATGFLADKVNTFERRVLILILRSVGGSVGRAAKVAGRNRTEFYRLLERHAIEPARYRGTT